jgi:hypothetical protein
MVPDIRAIARGTDRRAALEFAPGWLVSRLSTFRRPLKAAELACGLGACQHVYPERPSSGTAKQ